MDLAEELEAMRKRFAALEVRVETVEKRPKDLEEQFAARGVRIKALEDRVDELEEALKSNDPH